MKLLFVIHQFFPQCRSGTEQYCLAVSQEARRRGHEVIVLSLHPIYDRDDPKVLLFEEGYDGFRVLRLRLYAGLDDNDVRREYENPIAAARFRQVLATLRPDAVHFFHLRNLGSDLLVETHDAGLRSVVNLMDFWFLCPRFTLLRSDGSLCDGPPRRGLGCIPCMYPELAELHADEQAVDRALQGPAPRPSREPAERFKALIRRKPVLLERLGLADRVVAPSRFLKHTFVANGVPAETMQVVPYGLAPGRVTRRQVERPRQPLRLGFLGVLSPWKAPHLVIEAMRRVPGEIRFSVHGETEMATFATYIRSTIQAAAKDDRIRFCGAFGPGELSDVLAELDLLVVPSIWHENTPFVILEAFAAGVPVIASDLGGMSELVTDGENGYLFPRGDVEALAGILRHCLARPELVAELEPLPPPDIAANFDRFSIFYS